MTKEHDAKRNDLAAYVLGALDEREATAIERHLDDCPKCREYIQWLTPAANTLGASVNQVEPPSRLKRSLMDAVEADVKEIRRAERDEARTSRGFWGTFWRPVTAVALSAVLIAGAAGGYLLSENDEQFTTTPLATTETGVGAKMAATLEHDGDGGTIHVAKLPALPKDRVYQAWIERDGALRPSTPFVIKHDGGVEVALEGSLEGASSVKITREPNPGSQIPTSKVIMEAELS